MLHHAGSRCLASARRARSPYQNHSQTVGPFNPLARPSVQPALTAAAKNGAAPDVTVHGTSPGSGGEETGTGCTFACPFYKLNPHIYDECKKFQLSRISDVKQHLCRRHSLKVAEFSCTICWSDCKDEQSLNAHRQQGPCQSNARPEELNPDEVEQLKIRQRGDHSAQWFAIWDQLFPGNAAPHSPYIRSNIIQEVSSLICPTIEAGFHAALPSLQQQLPQLQLQHHHTRAKLFSFLQMVVNNAPDELCHNLPTSRHRSPMDNSDSPAAIYNNIVYVTAGQTQPEHDNPVSAVEFGPLWLEDDMGLNYNMISPMGLPQTYPEAPSDASSLTFEREPPMNGQLSTEYSIPDYGIHFEADTNHLGGSW